MALRDKPLSEHVALITGGDEEPRAGAMHVHNMARTFPFALSLDREGIREDINLYAGG
ncbi:MAG TPA: hypothetical protein VF703_12650 [Pyrinomonadaceae bacterium]|jgi:hypothetical protein